MPFVPFIDPLYIIFLLPGLLVTIVAMFLLRIWTDENRRRINSQGLSGADVLQKIAQAKGFPISMAITDQELGDNYNPLNKTVTLSMAVANERSILLLESLLTNLVMLSNTLAEALSWQFEPLLPQLYQSVAT